MHRRRRKRRKNVFFLKFIMIVSTIHLREIK